MISSWSCDMEGHEKQCVESYCELANKNMEQLYKVSKPCVDDHLLKQGELENGGIICKRDFSGKTVALKSTVNPLLSFPNV